MTFFYDLNKRLADLASKQDATQISEDAKAVAPKSKLAESIDVAEAGYSAKAARAGKDIGKPGKNFSKIAADAGKRYGSKAAGERVAGAVLNKLRHPKEDIENEGNAFTGALAKTPKGGKFKVGGKEFTDTSSLEEGMCPGCGCSPCKCDSMEESALQAYLGKKKYGDKGMKALQQAGREHAGKEKMAKIRAQYDKMDEGDMEEGNAFTAALKATPKGGKFKVGGKEFTDTSDLEEGFKEMDAWLASREKEKGTGKFDKKERTLPGGTKATTYTRKHEDDEEDKDDSKSDQAEKYASPKKKGRPKSAASKDSERVTKGSHKYKTVDGKRVKKEKTKEGLDSDGVMMTRSTNCSSESAIPVTDRGEYDDEAGMTKDSLHTIIRHARELEQALRSNENLPEWVQEKVGQIKGMMSSVTDYIISTHERDVEHRTGREGLTTVMPEGWRGGMLGEPSVVKTRTSKNADATQEALAGLMAIATRGGPGMDPRTQQYLLKIAKTLAKPESTELDEKAVSQAQRRAAGIAHAAQKGEIPKSKLRGASKEMAKMPQGELHKFAATKEKGLPKKVKEGGKPDFLDLDKDGDKKEPMKKAAKEKSSNKEDKVDETTVAGSVATASPSGKSSGGGMQFGKGVYEGFNRQVESMITESIDVADTIAENEGKTITVTASGPEADMLMQLLKAAGLSGSSQGCGCGNTPCSCETVDEAYGDTDETLNDPDWPTDTETLAAQPELRTYSGGLNGPKSTGQTTVPVVASQLRRQVSMEENVDLERSLFKTWKNYKG